MSLYRHKQMLEKVQEWACVTRFSFPAVVVLKFGGCSLVAISNDSSVLLIVSAFVSLLGLLIHRKVSANLSQFIAAIHGDENLLQQYHRDAEIGRHEDMINNLRAEMTGAYMLAADQAKRGHGYSSGFFYGRGKIAESILRRLGY